MPLAAEHTDVLMLMVCTFRRDRLQPYGQERPTSPFLQLLSEHGVLFEHAIVQSSWTKPSMGSLLTGRWTGVLQLDDPGDRGHTNRALAPGFYTAAEALKAGGYRTLGASANPNVSSTFGFDQGFDLHHEPEHLWRDSDEASPTGDQLIEQLLADLDDTPAHQRVYLQALFVDTHAPRRPSRQAIRAVKVEGVETTQRVLQYDASLLTLDAHLARMLLEVQARRPNLLVAVVGDHGEGLKLPEHHGKGHGNHLYTTTTQVPLLWWHPALPEQGRSIDGLTMGVDLLPTLLDLLHLPAPTPLDGDSQAPAILGETGRASHELAFTETLFRKSSKTAVIGQGYHLVRDHKAGPKRERIDEALYDLDEALQQTDLSGNHPRVLELLGAELDAWEAEVRHARDSSGDPIEGAPSEATLQQLRTLGYIE